MAYLAGGPLAHDESRPGHLYMRGTVPTFESCLGAQGSRCLFPHVDCLMIDEKKSGLNIKLCDRD
jgi:hypothetical protein